MATGGNPGLTPPVNNGAITMVSVLGQCGALSASTFIEINEVTTVAAASALATFIAPPSNIGSSGSDAAALSAAFTEAINLADTSTGTSPGVGQSVNSTTDPSVPASTINTLANALASCVNSTGSTASGTPCNKLFTVTGSPSNVFSSATNVELDPAAYDATAIFNLASSSGPFQPPLTAPPATFAIAPTSPSGSVSTSALTITPGSGAPGDTIVITAKAGVTFTPPLSITIGAAEAAGSFTSTEITFTVPADTGSGYVNSNVTVATAAAPYSQSYPFTFYVYDNSALSLVAVGPSSLTFPAQTVLTQSTSQLVTVTNNGAVAVQIDKTRITGTDNSSFTVTASTCTAAPLAAGASCTVSVAFQPAAVSSLSATLSVYVNGMASASTVALSGTGT